VQPERRPQQLVVVPADRRVEAARLRDAAVVGAAVPVPELEQLDGRHVRLHWRSPASKGIPEQRPSDLLRVVEEVRVMRVGAAEDEGGGGEGGGRLAGEVGAGVVLVDAVRLARRRHVLGPLPAVVVRVAVPHLRAETSQLLCVPAAAVNLILEIEMGE
jgi:hypothetical protein